MELKPPFQVREGGVGWEKIAVDSNILTSLAHNQSKLSS
jgi:hypothetical protein